MQIKHVGLQGPLWIPAFQADIEPGEVIDVVDTTFAKSLLDQPDNWAPADDEGKTYLAEVADGHAAVASFAAELEAWGLAVAEKAAASAAEALFHRVEVAVRRRAKPKADPVTE